MSLLNILKDTGQIILKELDQVLNFLGNHSYIGLTGTTLPVGASLAYQAAVNPSHPHWLQVVSWIMAAMVGMFTVLAIIKTHTTAFDKIKWIKKDKSK